MLNHRCSPWRGTKGEVKTFARMLIWSLGGAKYKGSSRGSGSPWRKVVLTTSPHQRYQTAPSRFIFLFRPRNQNGIDQHLWLPQWSCTLAGQGVEVRVQATQSHNSSFSSKGSTSFGFVSIRCTGSKDSFATLRCGHDLICSLLVNWLDTTKSHPGLLLILCSLNELGQVVAALFNNHAPR